VPRSIVFIGPVCAGKSTLAALVADALGSANVDLDEVERERGWYAEAGMSIEEMFARGGVVGIVQATTEWEPTLLRVAERVLHEYPDAVISFGAGHSHYRDDALFARVRAALADRFVVFVLPDPDPAVSVTELRKRSVADRDADWIYGDFDFMDHWVRDACNHELADYVLYTRGRTPEECAAEIVSLAKRRV